MTLDSSEKRAAIRRAFEAGKKQLQSLESGRNSGASKASVCESGGLPANRVALNRQLPTTCAASFNFRLGD
jgi:hypothetical protein